MEPEFHKGFIVYKRGEGPTYVAMHAGPAMEVTTSRDDFSDAIASLCWLKTGGTLITSGTPRKRINGVDFNRDIPPKELSKKMYRKFIENIEHEKLFEYRKKYAWVAKDDKDYYQRLAVYNQFWSKIRLSGNFTVFVHRKFSRLKNYPSIMDLVSFYGLGIDKKVLEKIIEELNEKNEEFFKSIWPRLRDGICLEQRRVFEELLEKFGSTEKLHGEFKENMEKDMEVLEKWSDKRMLKRFKNKKNTSNFIRAVKSAIRKGPVPMVTMEHAFRGDVAFGPRKQYIGKSKNIAIEIECNQLVSFSNPQEISAIIVELLEKIKKAEMYQKMGFSQTKIMNYIKN